VETIKRQTASYLFQTSDKIVRAIPFYELSIDEWVVYENGQPKYLLDFNRRDKPLIQDLRKKLNQGEKLEDNVWRLGRFLGKDWTTRHNIEGTEIQSSWQIENVELILLDDLSELFIDLTFVATDNIDFDILLDDKKLFNAYSTDNELLIETYFTDNYNSLVRMLTFLFKTNVELNKLAFNSEKDIFDLTAYRQDCLSEIELEDNYNKWTDIVNGNTMDEFGHAMVLIGYITRNRHKNHLVLIAEKRRHW
jgi:hypothetical protein